MLYHFEDHRACKNFAANRSTVWHDEFSTNIKMIISQPSSTHFLIFSKTVLSKAHAKNES